MPALLSQQYARGLSDERLVKQWLTAQRLALTEPTKEEDQRLDIDCFVNGVPASIKAEHAGAKYGNIYFELGQQLTRASDCKKTAKVLEQLMQDVGTSSDRVAALDSLIALGTWEPGWYKSGKALVYYILQGDSLLVYSKAAIVRHVAENGWLRLRPLSQQRKDYLGGSYRYCNSVCGFLDTASVSGLRYRIERFI